MGILEKKIGVGQPNVLEDCKILVANCQMDTDKIKIYGARVKVESFEAVAEIEKAEKDKMKAKVEKICKHGCNVFINRQLIYNYPDNPEETKLGFCKRIEEIMIGEDKVIKFSGCAQGEACTIVLRGASQHILDEAERSLHDALAVLYQTVQDSRVVYGGGAMEMAMANAVLQKLPEVEGKESNAVEAFAKALQGLPAILADNGGYDSAELLGKLKASHARGEHTVGLNFASGGLGDMAELGILESFRSKISQLCSAAEAAEQIIRVDDIIKNAPRQRDGGM